MNRGAEVVKEPWEESDENGQVMFASIQTVCALIFSQALAGGSRDVCGEV